MILGELARISDHLTCNGAMAMELGAFTPFLWFIKAREMIWDILEEETGARLTHSFGRIGGMAKPPTAELQGACPRRASPQILTLVDEGEKLLLKNRIFLDRLENVGIISRRRRDRARLDGPMPALDRRRRTTSARRTRTSSTTRSTSTSRSARAATTSIASWCASRRSARARASSSRRSSACPTTARSTSTTRASSCPPKDDVYTTIEGTIQHFKIVMEGVKVPAGEVLLVHRGRQRRARLLPRLRRQRHAVPRAHPPAVLPDHARASSSSSPGRMLADIVPTFGSLNMIGGECDH